MNVRSVKTETEIPVGEVSHVVMHCVDGQPRMLKLVMSGGSVVTVESPYGITVGVGDPE